MSLEPGIYLKGGLEVSFRGKRSESGVLTNEPQVEPQACVLYYSYTISLCQYLVLAIDILMRCPEVASFECCTHVRT